MYISSKFKSQLSFNWYLNLSKVCATQSCGEFQPIKSLEITLTINLRLTTFCEIDPWSLASIKWVFTQLGFTFETYFKIYYLWIWFLNSRTLNLIPVCNLVSIQKVKFHFSRSFEIYVLESCPCLLQLVAGVSVS